MTRTTKILAAAFIGAIGLLFFLDNLFNLATAHAVVSMVISGAEQPYYKMIGPALTADWLGWAALFTIMAGELAIGVLGLTGAVQMVLARSGSAEEFHYSKRFALHAGVLGMLVWYGLFIVIGESYFNMWQFETGLGSVEGAFRYGTVCAVLMFFVGQADD